MTTIRDLLESCEFDCTLLAGEAGVGNEITWAHVNEMRDPTAWLVGGELVMSTGIVMPPEPEEQVAYIRRLAVKKVAGLALGDSNINKLDVVPLADALLAEAEQLGFPIILVSGGTPFVPIIQRVAVANRDMLHRRLTRRLAVYETLNDAVISYRSISSLMRRLSEVSGYDIWIVTPGGKPFFTDSEPPPFSLVELDIKRILLDEQAQVPRRLHASDDDPVFAVPILARHRPAGVLLARPLDDDLADSLILNHLSAIMSLVAVDELRERERLRRDGAEALTRLLVAAEAGSLTSIGDPFEARSGARYCFVSILLSDDADGWDDLHNSLSEEDFAHVITRGSGRAAAVVELAPDTSVEALCHVWSQALPTCVVGISAELPPETEMLAARRQARWALQCAVALGVGVQHYAEARPPGWLLPDTSGLELLVDQLLQPLHSHDERTGSELHRTLTVFLEENRSWKAASQRLFIHRQTLIHRIKRIEQLTGRRLHSIDDVCDLWLALKAERTVAVAP